MLKPKWLEKIENHFPEKLSNATNSLGHYATGLGTNMKYACILSGKSLFKAAEYAADKLDETIETLHDKGLM
jgi:hypothetical protein